MKTFWSLLLGLMFAVSSAQAKQIKKLVDYKDGDQVLEGYLSYDDAGGKKPVVVVVHEWMGLNDYAKKRADMLAKEGYLAFAADIYGKGIRAKDTKEAGELSSKFKNDRALLRRRIQAAVNTAKMQPKADSSKVAAIGYCFGGTAVLELARSGADVKGVVSFHGGLDNPNPPSQNIKAKVLALHGADDPFVPLKAVHEFEDEMKKSKADFEVTLYSGAVHSFTNPESGNDPSKGIAYNAEADHRSWIAMNDFLREIFSK